MFSPAGHAWLHGGKRSTYSGRIVRHAPVLFARLEPTSSVMAYGLCMPRLLLQEAELLDVPVRRHLDEREAALVARIAEQMREALLQLEVIRDRNLVPDGRDPRDLAVARLEQREQPALDREARNTDGVLGSGAPPQRTRHQHVDVARPAD